MSSAHYFHCAGRDRCVLCHQGRLQWVHCFCSESQCQQRNCGWVHWHERGDWKWHEGPASQQQTAGWVEPEPGVWARPHPCCQRGNELHCLTVCQLSLRWNCFTLLKSRVFQVCGSRLAEPCTPLRCDAEQLCPPGGTPPCQQGQKCVGALPLGKKADSDAAGVKDRLDRLTKKITDTVEKVAALVSCHSISSPYVMLVNRVHRGISKHPGTESLAGWTTCHLKYEVPRQEVRNTNTKRENTTH